MERVELRMSNDTPFCQLSRSFPDLKIYRWCSSVIDYVVITGDRKQINASSDELMNIVEGIHSRVLQESNERGTKTSSISCRCNVNNSSIRLAESTNLMWESPAFYHNGFEYIKLISFSSGDLSRFFDAASEKGDVRVESKKNVLPESLREIYTISLADIFGNLSELQIRYLKDAIGMGLFSSPRKIKVEDLAHRFGVSKSTMQEHVNKARNKLIRAMEPYLSLYSAEPNMETEN